MAVQRTEKNGTARKKDGRNSGRPAQGSMVARCGAEPDGKCSGREPRGELNGVSFRSLPSPPPKHLPSDLLKPRPSSESRQSQGGFGTGLEMHPRGDCFTYIDCTLRRPTHLPERDSTPVYSTANFHEISRSEISTVGEDPTRSGRLLQLQLT
ncbi:hypothetical protein BKA81DRAFT_60134 [Phyllosticta paracitricarpa]